MADTHIELTEDEFDEQFPLVTNHLDPHASWAFDDGRGCLFGTYGEEIVLSASKTLARSGRSSIPMATTRLLSAVFISSIASATSSAQFPCPRA